VKITPSDKIRSPQENRPQEKDRGNSTNRKLPQITTTKQDAN
jgi:hypothetical protein